MPQSLRKRFNGNSDEVIEYTRLWGRFKAMGKYGVRDYLAFSRFVEEKTGDANFGFRPVLAGSSDRSWAEDLLDAFLQKVSKMETEKRGLEAEVKQLRLEIEYYKGQEAIRIEPRVQKVMALCRE